MKSGGPSKEDLGHAIDSSALPVIDAGRSGPKIRASGAHFFLGAWQATATVTAVPEGRPHPALGSTRGH